MRRFLDFRTVGTGRRWTTLKNVSSNRDPRFVWCLRRISALQSLRRLQAAVTKILCRAKISRTSSPLLMGEVSWWEKFEVLRTGCGYLAKQAKELLSSGAFIDALPG